MDKRDEVENERAGSGSGLLIVEIQWGLSSYFCLGGVILELKQKGV